MHIFLPSYFSKKILFISFSVRKIPIVEYEESSLEMDSSASISCSTWRPDLIREEISCSPPRLQQGSSNKTGLRTDSGRKSPPNLNGEKGGNEPNASRADQYKVTQLPEDNIDDRVRLGDVHREIAQSIDEMFSPIFDSHEISEEKEEKEEKVTKEEKNQDREGHRANVDTGQSEESADGTPQSIDDDQKHRREEERSKAKCEKSSKILSGGAQENLAFEE
jgi:hypothetical protein